MMLYQILQRISIQLLNSSTFLLQIALYKYLIVMHFALILI